MGWGGWWKTRWSQSLRWTGGLLIPTLIATRTDRQVEGGVEEEEEEEDREEVLA